MGPTFLTAADADKNRSVTREEFVQTFQRWFEAWNKDRSGSLSEPQLRVGIDQELAPFRGRPSGGFGFLPGALAPAGTCRGRDAEHGAALSTGRLAGIPSVTAAR
ncbi:MAG: hypothetical protein M5U12_14220 [Verrucomicrobia bacterium]|nr:hypothetical protein [Verrucomicrobiota bacterium]